MSPPDRDTDNLRYYEDILARIDARISEATKERATVAPIVDALRLRVNGTASVGQAATSAVEPADDAESTLRRSRVRQGGAGATYRGRPTIPSLILEIMSDGETWTLDEIYDKLEHHPELDDAPARRGVINRLGDLAQDGRLEKLRRGVYKLGPKAAEDGNASETPSRSPDQKTLDDRDAGDDRPGHPSGLDG